MDTFCRHWFMSVILFVVCSTGLTEAVVEKTIVKSKQELAREKMLTLLSGDWICRGLYVATKLQIADHLQAEAKSIEDLAVLTGSNPDSLNRLLHMLENSGFVLENIYPTATEFSILEARKK